ncbi:MAG TPA: hypothetical protein VG711_08800 [Phycisphaerales bacterium]|nr:hypothetical protein [Phycisphaerales bacterium]
MNWLTDILKSGTDVLELYIALAMKRARQAGILLVALVAAGVVSGVAMCGFLAGITIFLERVVGTPTALLIVSCVVLLALCIACVLTLRKSTQMIKRLESRVMAARRRMDDLLTPDSNMSTTSSGAETILDAIRNAAANPGLVLSAGFALLSILGVARTLRLVKAGSLFASAGSAAVKFASSFPSAKISDWLHKK